MTEQELRVKIYDIMERVLDDTFFPCTRDSIIKRMVDALIAADLRFGNKPKIFVENAPIPTTCVDNTIYLVPNTPPMIKQLYGDEEVE